MSTPGSHLRSLTSLRFFAAAVVVAYHAGKWSQVDGGAPSGVFRFGFVGVSFFFLLSGLVLAWTWRPGEPLRRFYLRRFARVWPLHALTTCAAIGLWAVGGVVAANWDALPAHALLVQAWSTSADSVFAWNGLSWSLSAEAFFYALFPAIVVLTDRHRVGPVLAAGSGVTWLFVIGGAVLLTTPELVGPLYWLPWYRIGEFVVGVALGVALRRGWRTRAPRWLGLGAGSGGYAVLWLGNRATGGFFEENLWACHLVVLPGFVVLLASCASADLGASTVSLLHHRALVRLGQWSFALYLVHELVLRAVHPWAVQAPWVAWAGAVASVILAGAAYEWYERPLERRIRHRDAHSRAEERPALS